MYLCYTYTLGSVASTGAWQRTRGPHYCEKLTFLLPAAISCPQLLSYWWAFVLHAGVLGSLHSYHRNNTHFIESVTVHPDSIGQDWAVLRDQSLGLSDQGSL